MDNARWYTMAWEQHTKPSRNDPSTYIACLSNFKLAHEKILQEFEITKYWMAFFIHIKMFDLLITSP
jgi:hypothetical protein